MFYSQIEIITSNNVSIVPFLFASQSFEEAWSKLHELMNEYDNISKAIILEDDRIIACARIIK